MILQKGTKLLILNEQGEGFEATIKFVSAFQIQQKDDPEAPMQLQLILGKRWKKEQYFPRFPSRMVDGVVIEET